ncbi:SPOR domain-containing protein [Tenacibaculum sp. MEBiC06402]|uniref:HU domain-containing protein n=1 Tax=unclassified Tenacibaculum TaxID=2635139 RepID=UPI003B9D8A4C
MTLKSYIQDLLYRYDCVIVPGFGGFITNKIGATIEGSTIYPPSKRISFNAQLNHNDGLFVNHVASIEKISFNEANAKVAEAVNEWNQKLQNNQPLLVDGLGTVTINSENQLNFEPNGKVNFDMNSFGFAEVNGIAKITTEVVEDTKVVALQTNSEETTKEVSSAGNFLKYAAGAAILVAGFIGVNKYQESTQLQELAEERDAIEQKIQKATFVINDQLPTVSLDVTKENNLIHIIAGAFQLEKNAEKKIKQLQNRGYEEAKIIGKNEWGLTQVSLGSFATKEAAEEAIIDIRAKVSSDAWILVKEE